MSYEYVRVCDSFSFFFAAAAAAVYIQHSEMSGSFWVLAVLILRTYEHPSGSYFSGRDDPEYNMNSHSTVRRHGSTTAVRTRCELLVRTTALYSHDTHQSAVRAGMDVTRT